MEQCAIQTPHIRPLLYHNTCWVDYAQRFLEAGAAVLQLQMCQLENAAKDIDKSLSCLLQVTNLTCLCTLPVLLLLSQLQLLLMARSVIC